MPAKRYMARKNQLGHTPTYPNPQEYVEVVMATDHNVILEALEEAGRRLIAVGAGAWGRHALRVAGVEMLTPPEEEKP